MWDIKKYVNECGNVTEVIIKFHGKSKVSKV